MSYESIELGYDSGYDTDLVRPTETTSKQSIPSEKNSLSYAMMSQRQTSSVSKPQAFPLWNNPKTDENEEKRGVKVEVVGKFEDGRILLRYRHTDPKTKKEKTLMDSVKKEEVEGLIGKDAYKKLDFDSLPTISNKENKTAFNEYNKVIKANPKHDPDKSDLGKFGMPETTPADIAKADKAREWKAVEKRLKEEYKFTDREIAFAKNALEGKDPGKILKLDFPPMKTFSKAKQAEAKVYVMENYLGKQKLEIDRYFDPKAKRPMGESDAILAWKCNQIGIDIDNIKASDMEKFADNYVSVDTWIQSHVEDKDKDLTRKKILSSYEKKAKKTLGPLFGKGAQGETDAGAYLKEKYGDNLAGYRQVILDYQDISKRGAIKTEVNNFKSELKTNPEKKREFDLATGRKPKEPKKPPVSKNKNINAVNQIKYQSALNRYGEEVKGQNDLANNKVRLKQQEEYDDGKRVKDEASTNRTTDHKAEQDRETNTQNNQEQFELREKSADKQLVRDKEKSDHDAVNMRETNTRNNREQLGNSIMGEIFRGMITALFGPAFETANRRLDAGLQTSAQILTTVLGGSYTPQGRQH